MQLYVILENWKDGAHGVQRIHCSIVQLVDAIDAYHEAADAMAFAKRATGHDYWTEVHHPGRYQGEFPPVRRR